MTKLKTFTSTKSCVLRPGTATRKARVAVSTGLTTYVTKRVVASPATSTPQRRAAPRTANEWVRLHQDKLQPYRGKWLAVGPTGIVGHSDDFSAVFTQAHKRGVSDPLVFKIPLHHASKIVSAKR
jgi:hypothetical protein